MSELGRLLAETRTAKDLSLADVEDNIRVRQKYLEALEQGDYAALPPSAIARGFLRNYARFLGLDSSEVLQLYGAESGDRGPAFPLAGPNGGRPVDYRPLEVTLMHEKPSNWGRWLLALVLVAGLAVAGWWLLSNQNKIALPGGSNWLAAFGPRATNTATATATGVHVTVTPPAAPPAQGVPVAVAAAPAANTSTVPTPTSDLLTLPIPTVQPTATRTPTPRPTATLEPSTGISLTMKTTQRAWTKVTADGKVLMQELLEAGQDRGFDAAEQMVVLTGNAGGVILTVNSQEIGTLGNVGQVVERTWVVNPDGQVAEATPDKRTASAGEAPAQTAASTPTAAP